MSLYGDMWARTEMRPSLMAVTKALADESRVRILLALGPGGLCVCQVVELLQPAPSTVSKHMSILKQAPLGRKPQGGAVDVLSPSPTTTRPAKPGKCRRWFSAA